MIVEDEYYNYNNNSNNNSLYLTRVTLITIKVFSLVAF